ncbi:MAG: sulfatase-like hydrolase/transferase [Planctomycetota bacterium]
MIKKQHPLWFAILSIGMLGACADLPSPLLAQTAKPNIVLIMADDQGWGQTSYNGHPILKTPNLDAMANRGLRFNRFYAAAPVCSPTRAAVLTGRTHRRCGVESHGYALRRNEKTIAQALQRAGYATGHFGKWHLNGFRGPGVPILKDDPYRPDQFGFQSWLSVSNFFDMDPIMSRNGEFQEFRGDSSEIIVAEALEFIEKSARVNQPSFSVIWYGTPHNPFKASDEDTAPFSELDKQSRTQLGELVAMDRSIGTLRKRLLKLGIADNTLVWFTSDNGGLPRMKPETTGGLRGFKGSLYEGGLRVPGIIEWPAKIQPRVTNYPAVSMDIFPTLAEIVGINESNWLTPQDGVSLVSVFDNELESRNKPIGFSYSGNAALIDNQWKLVKTKSKKSKPSQMELFDLSADNQEANNLFSKRPEIAKEMGAKMAEFERSVQKSVDGEDYDQPIAADHRPPTQWTEFEGYQPYLSKWKKRWEYQGRIK